MARLRDKALVLIASKTIHQLTSPEGKAELRGEILSGTVPIVAPGAVREALFSDIVVQ
jgi:flagellar basal body-associated protein FliL